MCPISMPPGYPSPVHIRLCPIESSKAIYNEKKLLKQVDGRSWFGNHWRCVFSPRLCLSVLPLPLLTNVVPTYAADGGRGYTC